MDEGQRDLKSRLVEVLNYPFIALLVLWIQFQALGEAMAYEPETAAQQKRTARRHRTKRRAVPVR